MTNPFDEDELGPTQVRNALSGKKAGEYVLGERLGEGAMGVVYKGVHPLLGRQAAVKVLRSESPDAAVRLLAEARLVAQARHPNIIDIFGFGTTDDGQPYFVMELLEGEALDLWLRNRPPLQPAEVVGVLKQLLSGLAAAHAANVIHRDLKPSNLFMARLADGTHFLKILDFGLSKQFDPSAPEKTLGTMVGTPLYMAPEQTIGQPSTPATDLYAAGCIAYELLTGAPPFNSPSLLELLKLQKEAVPPPLPDSVPQLLRELVMALLEKQPAKRPASAAAARQLLDRVERRIIAATPTGTLPPLTSARPRPSRPAPPPPAAEKPTVLLPKTSSSQERETVKMEPVKLELPPRRAPSVSKVPVAEPKQEPEQTVTRRATAPTLPASAPLAKSNTPLLIMLVVGVLVVLTLLAVFLKN